MLTGIITLQKYALSAAKRPMKVEQSTAMGTVGLRCAVDVVSVIPGENLIKPKFKGNGELSRSGSTFQKVCLGEPTKRLHKEAHVPSERIAARYRRRRPLRAIQRHIGIRNRQCSRGTCLAQYSATRRARSAAATHGGAAPLSPRRAQRGLRLFSRVPATATRPTTQILAISGRYLVEGRSRQ